METQIGKKIMPKIILVNENQMIIITYIIVIWIITIQIILWLLT